MFAIVPSPNSAANQQIKALFQPFSFFAVLEVIKYASQMNERCGKIQIFTTGQFVLALSGRHFAAITGPAENGHELHLREPTKSR